MAVKLHRVDRQTLRVGMVLTMLGQTLLAKLGGPGLKGQTAGKQCRKILERPRAGRRRFAEGPNQRRRRRSGGLAAVPDSGKVRVTVGSPGRGRIEVDFSIRQPRRRRGFVGWPLCPEGRGNNRDGCQPDDHCWILYRTWQDWWGQICGGRGGLQSFDRSIYLWIGNCG